MFVPDRPGTATDRGSGRSGLDTGPSAGARPTTPAARHTPLNRQPAPSSPTTAPENRLPGNDAVSKISTATNTVTGTVPTSAGAFAVAELDVSVAGTPVVTGISPSSGPTAGGTAVTITGTDLTGATAVAFGSDPAASFTVDSDTQITATTPPGTPGTVDVTVTTAGGTSTVSAADQFTYIAPTADIDVSVTGQPHLGILVPYLTYTLTAHNTGPDAITSATVTASLPAGASATGLSTGCTTSTGTVTCTYGAIANAASVNKSFRVPLNLLSLGHVTVTGTLTASTPTDPNPANDSASATCTAISIILATCP
ncbi:IPT/TIG domain-containing protein OS=Streptomyces microflavus OX=1919 GN=Smic_87380 PE=4 SV=1 [Streptomyces microflavus]